MDNIGRKDHSFYGTQGRDTSDYDSYSDDYDSPDDDDFYFLEPDDTEPDQLFQALKGKKKLIVPRLQRMDDYIKKHYSKALSKKICQWINSEFVAVDTECPPKTIPDSIELGKMKFWRENRTTVRVVITVSVAIEVVQQREACIEENTYFAELGFWLKEGTAFLERTFFLSENEPEYKNLWPLNEYLVPHLRKPDVEKYAEQFIYGKLPSARHDQKTNNAYDLAKKLGLKVQSYNLQGYPRTRSILFFQSGTIRVKEYDEVAGQWIKSSVAVGANTIVINNEVVKVDSPVLDVYHECIHYEWHYLFYRLQKMYNNDLKQIRKLYKIHYDNSDQKDPLSWIEWQARQGSMSMWMPQSFMREELKTRWEKTPSTDHYGARYQSVARGISETYQIPKYRVRARLINMGHIEAKGALNYCDDHYIEPFCFYREKGSGNFSFFIPPKSFATLFTEDEDFRNLILTGHFVYVDGHICLNDAEYVTQTKSGPKMTKWANAHVDQCCLRFIEIYEQDEDLAYRFGRLNSDESYNRHYLTFPGCSNQDKSVKERKAALEDYVSSLKGMDFPEMLVKLMDDADMTVQQMEDQTGISESTIKRLRREQRETYTLDHIMGIIICLHLSPLVSYQLLDRAGIHMEGNPRMMVLLMIINLYFMDSLEDVQKRLVEYGHKKLKLKFDQDESEQQCSGEG